MFGVEEQPEEQEGSRGGGETDQQESPLQESLRLQKSPHRADTRPPNARVMNMLQVSTTTSSNVLCLALGYSVTGTMTSCSTSSMFCVCVSGTGLCSLTSCSNLPVPSMCVQMLCVHMLSVTFGSLLFREHQLQIKSEVGLCVYESVRNECEY